MGTRGVEKNWRPATKTLKAIQYGQSRNSLHGSQQNLASYRASRSRCCQQVGLRVDSPEADNDQFFSLSHEYETGTSYVDVSQHQAQQQNNFELDVEQRTSYKIGKFLAGITISGY